MLTYQEVIELSGLTPEEIDAVAEHEHVPELVAAEMGHYLVECPDGVPCIKRIILDDIAVAERHGRTEHVLHLRRVLKHFIRTHPEHETGSA